MFAPAGANAGMLSRWAEATSNCCGRWSASPLRTLSVD